MHQDEVGIQMSNASWWSHPLFSTLPVQNNLILTEWLNIIYLQTYRREKKSLFFRYMSSSVNRYDCPRNSFDIKVAHLLVLLHCKIKKQEGIARHFLMDGKFHAHPYQIRFVHWKTVHLHRNRFLKIPSHKSTPSSTWEAISGGIIGEGGPIIRSSPTNIVSSMVGCESTETNKSKHREKKLNRDYLRYQDSERLKLFEFDDESKTYQAFLEKVRDFCSPSMADGSLYDLRWSQLRLKSQHLKLRKLYSIVRAYLY